MDETRQYIFEQILEKYRVQAGHYINEKWINLAQVKAPIQVKKHFCDALQQMIDEDFFECKEGHGNTWFLTQNGEEALLNYITERNKKMNDNSSGINIQVNPVISPSFNQTNTQNLNVQLILQEQLDEETYKKIEEIIKSSIPQDEKNSKLKAFLGNLSFGVMSNILANLITSLPWG